MDHTIGHDRTSGLDSGWSGMLSSPTDQSGRLTPTKGSKAAPAQVDPLADGVPTLPVNLICSRPVG
ncbi:MAG: hypothetical protein KC547_04590 [Anaerolineae bacterium]|nr:hypothetical protein [Anaerolineae bacterium]